MNTSVKYYIVAFCLLLFVYGVPKSYTHSTGAPVGSSGAISDEQNTCESCHLTSSAISNLNSQVLISSELGEGDHYELGESYYIAITANSFGISKFGFQACIENSLGEKVGELILSETSSTQLIDDGNYITHTDGGSIGVGVKTWVFNWEAPQTPQGLVTLHTSVLFSNNNGLLTGDQVIYTSQTFTEPTFGCTLETAFNYNNENDIEDGSCLFSLNSDVLSLSFQTLNIIGPQGDDLGVEINIHNNTNDDLIVHAQRTIYSNEFPTNWFCWGVCYTPLINQSFYDQEIPSNSYVDEFSGHLMAGAGPGTYPIEYCFYPEGAIDDSICATVNFTVTGDIWGCLNPNAINFNNLANVDDSTCIVYPEPFWEFSDSYGFTHTVAISGQSNINIDNSPIAIGDWIGVFYDGGNGLVCAGYTEWLGTNTTITIQGFDPVSNQGFLENEQFIWQVWDASDGVSWPMSVTYSALQENQDLFQENGFSSIFSMENIVPITTQSFNIPNGWYLFSTYISTADMSVYSFFEPIQNDLIIVKNNIGEAYIVEYEFNAIGALLPGQAYLLKTNSASEFTVIGEYLKPELFPINLQEGWNMIAYLKIESEDANLIFQELISQDFIHIVKDYYGNALIPAWGFNGIGAMIPGEGYQVKAYAESILQY